MKIILIEELNGIREKVDGNTLYKHYGVWWFYEAYLYVERVDDYFF